MASSKFTLESGEKKVNFGFRSLNDVRYGRCEACARLHKKCDRLYPSCTRCAKTPGRECNYEYMSNPKGGGGTKGTSSFKISMSDFKSLSVKSKPALKGKRKVKERVEDSSSTLLQEDEDEETFGESDNCAFFKKIGEAPAVGPFSHVDRSTWQLALIAARDNLEKLNINARCDHEIRFQQDKVSPEVMASRKSLCKYALVADSVKTANCISFAFRLHYERGPNGIVRLRKKSPLTFVATNQYTMRLVFGTGAEMRRALLQGSEPHMSNTSFAELTAMSSYRPNPSESSVVIHKRFTMRDSQYNELDLPCELKMIVSPVGLPQYLQLSLRSTQRPVELLPSLLFAPNQEYRCVTSNPPTCDGSTEERKKQEEELPMMPFSTQQFYFDESSCSSGERDFFMQTDSMFFDCNTLTGPSLPFNCELPSLSGMSHSPSSQFSSSDSEPFSFDDSSW